MRAVKRRSRMKKRAVKNTDWLPIDRRLIPDIWSFKHVHGLARVFLEIEMILAVLIVVGTGALVVIKLFLYK